MSDLYEKGVGEGEIKIAFLEKSNIFILIVDKRCDIEEKAEDEEKCQIEDESGEEDEEGEHLSPSR